MLRCPSKRPTTRLFNHSKFSLFFRTMTNYTIEITSDTVCPWCYIGTSRLQRAIAEHSKANPGDTFELKWHSFYLRPDGPGFPGVNKLQMYENRFGDPARVQAMMKRIGAIGAEEGINFSFGGNTGSTRDSHRLIHLVGKHYGSEKQTEVVKALFKKYFEEEQNITDKEVLVDAAVKSAAQIPEKEVRGWLDSDVGGAEVDREARQARLNSITGVPFFNIQGKYSVEGAQDAAEFLRVFMAVKGVE
ncbi:DSBA-like thioredoxin domain protein [Talaromyces stipitatus ATCC 10500]|uniref:DSBA-like thioredoxin domain protein n=1 Tax=Talaromyces stipitatus (strain ATCC 10500 / CBS 375.48 / QM 6759 / NRRL 1006) TaxID=441959 RepID=B8MAY9_TALSN|nr:DSBA-like thioredoxin domain protein [Talaromyces stipitatus ATCC 10500]EED18690.1 DSBA-like thioredoxin domain protein [Talaromyces stipitatus ATCC 10500]